ncbi:MAG TPA: PDZ domain-containing protein, partial [Candidatus Eisenbacteria bacterium]|nr:PDZ domain-containing protein [Candidatus Eisenbacteria bacterium]
GLEEEDVILSLNGREVESVREATDLVRNLKPGSRLSISVLRDGRQRQFSATLAKREERADSEWLRDLERQPGPGDLDVPVPPAPPYLGEDDDVVIAPRGMGEPRGYLGVSTIELGEQLGEYFGLKGEGGVLVTEVSEDSPAEKAGLKAGDVILSVSDSKVDSPRDLMRLVRAHDPEEQVEIVVQRRGQAVTLNAKLGENKDMGMGLFAPRARGRWSSDPEIYMIGPEVHDKVRQQMKGLRDRLHHMRIMEHHRGGAAEI